MNAVTAIKPAGSALTVAEQNEAIRTALKTSLYPGASDASVDLVLAYCRASGLDPMTKPVHIVPMSVTVGKDERGYAKKETRDVVMPGIGLYRINAARTGEYAGCSEPEFGPTQHLQFKREVWEDGPNGKRVKKLVDGSLPYPEWCKVTVTKIVDGKEREFTAKEYWLENYAEKGDTGGPNSMWEKRPFAQLAKCTEAQALRKAFPEAVGSQPTADEMEGKDVIEGTATVVSSQPAINKPVEQPFYPEADFAANLPKWWDLIKSGKKTADEVIATIQTKGRLTEDQLKEIRNPPSDKQEVGEGEQA
jgi:phage recombination protein Bet